jgi:hypothetical protein
MSAARKTFERHEAELLTLRFLRIPSGLSNRRRIADVTHAAESLGRI